MHKAECSAGDNSVASRSPWHNLAGDLDAFSTGFHSVPAASSDSVQAEYHMHMCTSTIRALLHRKLESSQVGHQKPGSRSLEIRVLDKAARQAAPCESFQDPGDVARHLSIRLGQDLFRVATMPKPKGPWRPKASGSS